MPIIIIIMLFIMAIIDYKYKDISNKIMLPTLFFTFAFSLLFKFSVVTVVSILIFYLLLNTFSFVGLFGGADVKYFLIVFIQFGITVFSISLILSFYSLFLMQYVTKKSNFAFTPFIFVSLVVALIGTIYF